jgi:hypothetical protein
MTKQRVWIGLTAIEEAWRRGDFGYLPAQGTETQSATTAGRGPKDDGPVAESDAPR